MSVDSAVQAERPRQDGLRASAQQSSGQHSSRTQNGDDSLLPNGGDRSSHSARGAQSARSAAFARRSSSRGSGGPEEDQDNVPVLARMLRLQISSEISTALTSVLDHRMEALDSFAASLQNELVPTLNKQLELILLEISGLHRSVQESAAAGAAFHDMSHPHIAKVERFIEKMEQDGKGLNAWGGLAPEDFLGDGDEVASPCLEEKNAGTEAHAHCLEFHTAEHVDNEAEPSVQTGARRMVLEFTEDFAPGGFVGRLVTSKKFEAFCASVILLNTVHIAASSELAMAYNLDSPGTGPWAPSSVLAISSLSFFFWYSVETALKICAYGKQFFTGTDRAWNLFDLLLIVSSGYGIIEERFLDAEGGMNLSWMRLLRLLKMMKLLRVVRVMQSFAMLRVLMSAVRGSLATTVWSIVMLASITFTFAISFMQAVCTYAADMDATSIDEDHIAKLRLYWGTLGTAMESLFAVVTGGLHWRELSEQMYLVGIAYYILFLFYLSFSVFAVLNVITGIGVHAATQISQRDYETVIHEIMENNEDTIRELRIMFASMDDDGDGHITMEELSAALGKQEVAAFFSVLQIEPMDAERLFKLLGRGDNSSVPVSEFITGCMKLRGNAKSVDLVCQLSLSCRLLGQLGHFFEYAEEQFSDIRTSFRRMGISTKEGKSFVARVGPHAAHKPILDTARIK